MNRAIFNRLVICTLFATLCVGGPAAIGFAAEPVDFAGDIRPLLSDRCFLCHGPDAGQRASELRLDDPQSAYDLAIAPGDLAGSELVERIMSDDEDTMMPPPESNLSLSESERQLLKDWIEQGAVYEGHWSLQSATRPDLPSVKDEDWSRSEIDTFVLAKLEAAGLGPNPEADRAALIRRLSFDLTGLPPTLAEIDAFCLDERPNAYELLVDKLLARKSFGEKWAVDWLDVSRFADTYGYQNDRFRPMWPWRDWVVRALNDNLPYDQFITWQLAGDLLPDATQDQVLATAFNRNHRQTNEGGSVEEEFRAEYVADRVNTFGAAFLGLTLECCRCHDHKYDPISQHDYYALSAFFNSIDESGLYPHFNEAVPTPTLSLTDDEQQAQLAAAESRLAAFASEWGQVQANLDGFANWKSCLSDVRRQLASESAEPKSLAAALDESLGDDLLGHYPLEKLEDGEIVNAAVSDKPGKVQDTPEIIAGKLGKAVMLDGENGLSFSTGKDFSRNDPFSISFWLNVPKEYGRAVVMHRSRAWTDSGSRGYELLIEDGKLSFALIHFWPGNAARILTTRPVATNTWTHVALTYDGSSRASGMRIYIDGAPAETQTIRDKLTRHIDVSSELMIGNRFRDIGLKAGKLDELRVHARELAALEVKYLFLREAYPENVKESLYNLNDDLLRDFFNRQQPQWSESTAQLKELRDARSKISDNISEIMVMRELPEPRETFVLIRGAYDALGEQVERSLPKAILPTELPENASRLDLANWLTDPQHPLTARVAVNRFWQSIFGTGLVSTSEDFGMQGAAPSHPLLLDWLATQFVQEGWDTKALIKRIVMSATYRQSSDPSPKLLELDPQNRLLARGPIQRLTAEMLRDAALASSGLLVDELGGPPVKPYQPDGLWKEKSGLVYERDTQQGSWRRSLYTYWKRTSPPPSMMTFDASNREVCVVRRQATSTPLQTLVLLNDPQFVEAARALADSALQSTDSVDQQLGHLFRCLTSRSVTADELKILREMYSEQLAAFSESNEQVDAFLAIGDYQASVPPDDRVRLTQLAALTAVAEGLMSYDETVMKR